MSKFASGSGPTELSESAASEASHLCEIRLQLQPGLVYWEF